MVPPGRMEETGPAPFPAPGHPASPRLVRPASVSPCSGPGPLGRDVPRGHGARQPPPHEGARVGGRTVLAPPVGARPATSRAPACPRQPSLPARCLCVHRLVFPASRARAALINRAADDTFILRAAGGVNLWLPVPPGQGGTGARTPRGRPPPGAVGFRSAPRPGRSGALQCLGWTGSAGCWLGQGAANVPTCLPLVTRAGRRGRFPSPWTQPAAARPVGGVAGGEGRNPMGRPSSCSL